MIRVLVLNSNCSFINYRFISLLFNLIKINNLYITGNYGYKMMCLIMNFHPQTKNLITTIERKKLMKTLCYIHWYPFEIHNTNKLTIINTEFNHFLKNINSNNSNYYNINNIPNYVKKQLKQLSFSNESKKHIRHLKK